MAHKPPKPIPPTLALEPGESVSPLYAHCPRCGLNLEQFYQSEHAKRHADEIENGADEAGGARVSSDLVRPVDSGLQRMVSPLAHADEERPEGNEQGWGSRNYGQKASGCQQKDHQPGNHERLIPMVKRKFMQWIFHNRKA